MEAVFGVIVVIALLGAWIWFAWNHPVLAMIISLFDIFSS